MIPSFILAITLPILLGAVIVFVLWPQQKVFDWLFLAKGSIAVGIGFGVSSVIFFFWLIIFGPNKGFVIVETALFISLCMLLLYRLKGQKSSAQLETKENMILKKNGESILFGLFCIVFVFAVFQFMRMSFFMPHGEWDAWSIWNLTARFIFRGGEHWRDAFSPLLIWYKPDYPLLIQLSVARGWEIIGRDTPAVPIAIAFLFTFSIVLLMLSSVTIFRGKTYGLLAALVLLSTPFFLEQGCSQMADVPVAFFFLTPLILFSFHDKFERSNPNLLFLAGMTTGCSSWTKNEGFLFLIAILVSRSLSVIRTQGWRNCLRQAIPFLAGLIPVVLVSLYLKIYLAPNDHSNNLLLAQSLTATFEKLTDIKRYTQILNAFIGESFIFTRSNTFISDSFISTRGIVGFPLLVAYIFIVGPSRHSEDKVILDTVSMTFLLMVTGYFLVYVTTPLELNYHLHYSLNRLFIQLWPIFIFIIFMKAKRQETVALET
jgi:hypothetical protein